MRKELIGAASALALLSGAALAQDAAANRPMILDQQETVESTGAARSNATPSGSDDSAAELQTESAASGDAVGSPDADLQASDTGNATPTGRDISEGELDPSPGAEGAAAGSMSEGVAGSGTELEDRYGDQAAGSESLTDQSIHNETFGSEPADVGSSPDVATGTELEEKLVAPDVGNATKNGADISRGELSPSADLEGAAEEGMTSRLQGDTSQDVTR